MRQVSDNPHTATKRLVAGGCNVPDALVLPFRLELKI
jgi:hypothetical protein